MELSRPSWLRLPYLAVALLSAGVFTPSATAQEQTFPAATARSWAHEESDLKVDARIHYGSLANGMRYAWANNPEPKDRVYLRLHVDAGSFGETDTQLGMAHFLEHMAFNGSENFEAGTLIEWFQGHGMSFGADTNAHTAFSETVYKLDMPSREEEVLREGMKVMRDFAGGMLIAEDEVQAEKGVIDGEQRERDSAGFRSFLRMLDKMYAGTRYATRMPIGVKSVRDGFTSASVTAFYKRWYRPENMTIIVVGDLRGLDPSTVIEEFFADFKGPGTPVLKEPEAGKPLMNDLVFSIYEPELPSVQITVANLKPFVDNKDTIAQRQKDLVLQVANSMMALRFSEKVKLPDTPYLSASVSNAGGLEVFEGGELTVNSESEKWEESMISAYVELRIALNFGFQEAELKEVRADLLRTLDEAVARQATAHSAGIREAILAEVESGFIPTDAAYDLEIYRPMLEALTVEDCVKALRNNWRGGSLSLTTSGGLELEDAEAALMAAYAAAKEVKIAKGAIIEVKPFAYASDASMAGDVKKQVYIEDLDFWQVEYANGVRLNLKKTDFKDNQVLVNAHVGEGNLAIDEEALVSAAFAGFGVYIGGGLEEHDSDELRRILAGKQVGVSMTIEDDHFSFAGATTPEDLLLQFELTCAFLEDPGYRPDLLNVIRANVPLIFERFKHLPDGPMLFDFAPAVILGGKRASLLGLSYFPSLEELQGVEMEDIRLAIEPHLKTAPMEITIVGDIDINQVIALGAQTFGVLEPRRAVNPYEGRRSGVKVVAGVKVERSIDTLDQKATLMMLFPTTDGMVAANRRNLSFLGSIVNDRLRLEVRERLGAAYSPGAGAESSQIYHGLGGLLIRANGDPSKVDELVQACRGVAQSLATDGVTQEEVDRLSGPLLNQLRDAQRTNGYWLSTLGNAQSRPESLDELRVLVKFYENLSVKDLSALAAEYLLPDRASVLVVLPEIVEELITEDE
ncbi:MAG: insulinase family protein [Planctomycetota bacterium]